MIFPFILKKLPVLANALLMALIPSVIIFLAFPPDNPRFLLETAGSTTINDNTYIRYEDLDADGSSEKITAFDNPNSSGITIHSGGKTLNQWNLPGSFDFSKKETLFLAEDCDSDDIKELYVFTLKGDSVLITTISGWKGNELPATTKLVARTGPGIKGPDPAILKAEADDLDGDGIKEVIFGIITGFSKSPRAVYAFNTAVDTILRSPESSAFILEILQEDLDGDSHREIIPYGYGAGNIGTNEARYHDQSAWLMVLDRNLSFAFEPVEFRGRFVLAQPLLLRTGDKLITDLLVYPQDRDSTAYIVSFSAGGKITGRHNLEYLPYKGFITGDLKDNPLYVIMTAGEGAVIFDSDIKETGRIRGSASPLFFEDDVDLDGEKEVLVNSQEDGKLMIYRKGLRHPAECSITWGEGNSFFYSLITDMGKEPQIFIQAGDVQNLIEYRANNWYWINFGYYPLVFAAFTGFVMLILYLQKRSISRLQETEKKITELQLALVRNQLDPHFTFNALNAIVALVNRSEKEKARDGLILFSELYRTLLTSARSTRWSLGEEISFCRHYLLLEKMRFEEAFDFTINVNDDVDQEVEVPKLIIQLYAENSVKHGLQKKKDGGRLDINILKDGGKLLIEIADNGTGRNGVRAKDKDSNGMGLELMNELFRLYRKLYNDMITAEIYDLPDSGMNPAGTVVKVRIDHGEVAVFN